MLLPKVILVTALGLVLGHFTDVRAEVDDGVGASTNWLLPTKVVCWNKTTRKRVIIADEIDGISVWDCVAAGLVVNPGDQVRIQIYGLGASPSNNEEPALVFSYVPPYSSFQNLQGRIFNVNPNDYKIAIYIRVRGGWWTKPYWSTPLTSIRLDGTWECDITTGGVDQEATEITAYLLPNGVSAPLMSGGTVLPAILDSEAVAKATVTRAP